MEMITGNFYNYKNTRVKLCGYNSITKLAHIENKDEWKKLVSSDCLSDEESILKIKDTPKALLKELLDRLDHVYLKIDKTYGDLDYLVYDFIKYIHTTKTYKNLKRNNND